MVSLPSKDNAEYIIVPISFLRQSKKDDASFILTLRPSAYGKGMLIRDNDDFNKSVDKMSLDDKRLPLDDLSDIFKQYQASKSNSVIDKRNGLLEKYDDYEAVFNNIGASGPELGV